ncbi:MAG: nuclear transport factor 2 family protein [Gemmatimonadales bacterium]
MSSPSDNIEIVKSYFLAMQRSPGSVAAFYHPGVVQEEFPNRFLPNGARRGLKELGEAAERGRKVMASQEFRVLDMIADGDTVVVESEWSGTLAVPLPDGSPAGTVMRARFAQFFVIEDGKIVAQRNYDCFYPW